MIWRNLILPGVFVPLAFAAVARLATGLALARRERAAAGLAAAVAFVSAYVAMTGWPSWPPIEATARLFFVVALAGLAALLMPASGGWPRWALRAVFSAVLLGLVLESVVRHRWTGAEAGLWLAGLFALALALDRAASYGLEARSRPKTAALVRLTVLGTVAASLGLSGSARLAQLAGAFACGVLVVEIFALFGERRGWTAGDGLVWTTTLLGLVLSGHYYAELGLLPAALLLAAVLAFALARKRHWAWTLLPLLPAAIAVTLVVVAFLGAPEDPYAGYY